MELLFQQYYAALVFYATKITGDRACAREVVIDAFVQSWRRSLEDRSFAENEERICGHLFMLVRNAAIRFYREQLYKAGIINKFTYLDKNELSDYIIEEMIQEEADGNLDSISGSIKRWWNNSLRQKASHVDINEGINEDLSVHTIWNQRLKGIALLKSKIR